jgi:hypothetical protein
MVTMGRAAEDNAAGGHALEALKFDWGDAYDIALDQHSGIWGARRRDGRGGLIEAVTSDGLRKLIVEDYTFMPVPRDLT